MFKQLIIRRRLSKNFEVHVTIYPNYYLNPQYTITTFKYKNSFKDIVIAQNSSWIKSRQLYFQSYISRFMNGTIPLSTNETPHTRIITNLLYSLTGETICTHS